MMKYPLKRWLLTAIIILGALLLTCGIALAQASAPTAGTPTITWWTVDGGGGTAQGGGFTLMGTAGQPEPGPLLTGSEFTLTSGYWPGGLSGLIQKLLFLPFVTR
jgi:hypothetical protein